MLSIADPLRNVGTHYPDAMSRSRSRYIPQEIRAAVNPVSGNGPSRVHRCPRIWPDGSRPSAAAGDNIGQPFPPASNHLEPAGVALVRPEYRYRTRTFYVGRDLGKCRRDKSAVCGMNTFMSVRRVTRGDALK